MRLSTKLEQLSTLACVWSYKPLIGLAGGVIMYWSALRTITVFLLNII